ncbi:MAG: TetR/AcrR family transcriptional regulator [Alphaproteobacteria bacterium]|nr:TetR/AcrR family transcriptional regulator [Alphaproteobacteria bacterium]
MARRSDHSREELHELILSAARQLVERDGFKALTARRVAEVIGYSPGTLYNLFANQDDLVVQLNAQTLAMLDQALAGVRLSGKPEDDLLAQAMAYLSFLERHPRLWELLFEYRLGEDNPLPDWFNARVQELLQKVEAALAPLFGPRQGQKRAEAALVLWASLHGIGSLASSGKLDIVTSCKQDSLVRTLIVNFVAGLSRSS